MQDNKFYHFISIIFIVISFLTSAIIIFYIQRGLELTDNGYYSMSILQPADMTIVETRFGSIVAYLYDLVGQHIVRIRVAGALVLILSQAFLTYLMIDRIKLSDQFKAPNWLKHSALAVSTASSVMHYTWGMVIPSYNWATLVSVMWIVSGFILWHDYKKPKQSLFGVALVGIGFGILGWSKVTSGVLFALSVPLFLIFNYRSFKQLVNWKTIASGTAGLALMMILVILREKSVEQLINNVIETYHFQVNYGGRLEESFLLRIRDQLQSSLWQNLNYLKRFLPELLLPLIPLGFISVLGKQNRFLRHSAYLYMAGLYIYLMIDMTGDITNHRHPGLWVQSGFFIALLLYVIASIIYVLQDTTKYREMLAYSLKLVFGVSVVILALPYIIVYGTDNPYIMSIGFTGNILILGIMLFAIYLPNTIFRLGILIAVTIGVPLTMYNTYLTPYRQEIPYWEMTVSTPLRYGKETVLTSQAVHDYLTTLQNSALENGFIPGETPIMDFTGHVPNAVYAMDGRTYGIPWFLGGRWDSEQRVAYVLERWEPEDLLNAWLITSTDPEPVRSIDLSVLAQVGIDFDTHYEHVVDVILPYYDEQHALWKPKENH